MQDVAELAEVPEIQMVRILRMTATAGFLREPRRGYVAHTALSAQFVLKPALFDAVAFASEIQVPISLLMPAVTQMYGETLQPEKSAYSLAFKDTSTFATAWKQRPKVRRELAAFAQLGANGVQEDVEQLLSCLNWSQLGDALVVEVRGGICCLPALLTFVSDQDWCTIGRHGYISRQDVPKAACTCPGR